MTGRALPGFRLFDFHGRVTGEALLMVGPHESRAVGVAAVKGLPVTAAAGRRRFGRWTVVVTPLA